MKVLVVTNMYPNEDDPSMGVFVKEQIDSIKAQGVDIDVLFINGRKNKLNYLLGAVQVFKKSFTNHYDLIHAHYGLTGLLAGCQFRFPVIVSFCGSDVMDRFQGKISKFVSKRISTSIVKSQRLKEVLGDKSAYVIPSGVDFDLFRPILKTEALERVNLSPDKRYILFVGNPLKKVKRVDLAKKSCDIIKRDYKSVKLLSIYRKPHNLMPFYMNASEFLILTSEWGGSPNVIKEAMACNLPIVSVDVGDVKEIIGDTEGCYIAKRDPIDIAEKIRLVLERNKRFAEGNFRTNGREKIKHLSLESVSKKIIRIYKHFVEW